MAFVMLAMRCLRPGGVAVHTTEFNLSSDEDTLDTGLTVLLRQQDIKVLGERLANAGHTLAPMDLTRGDDFLDHYVDIPPYNPSAHLRLLIERYCSTSIMLIMRNQRTLSDLGKAANFGRT